MLPGQMANRRAVEIREWLSSFGQPSPEIQTEVER
jgi:hypothetical protein